jgi:hypothetical protein
MRNIKRTIICRELRRMFVNEVGENSWASRIINSIAKNRMIRKMMIAATKREPFFFVSAMLIDS